MSRPVKLSAPDRLELEHVYLDLKWSTRKCAKHFQMSQPWLRKYLKRYSIPIRTYTDMKSRLGQKCSALHRKRLSDTAKSSTRRYFKNTSIEIKMRNMLDALGVSYLQNHPLDKIANVDFYIPHKKLVIECDGDYWHNLPGVQENDRRKTLQLEAKGYKVLRFWEHEIRNMETVML